MKKPTYERQNQWLNDYVAPIIMHLDISQIIRNYRANRKRNCGEQLSPSVQKALEQMKKEDEFANQDYFSRYLQDSDDFNPKRENIDTILAQIRKKIKDYGIKKPLDRIVSARNKVLLDSLLEEGEISQENYKRLTTNYQSIGDMSVSCPCGSGKVAYKCCMS